MKSTRTGYGLWCLGLLGICGVHRFYLGRIVSGVIWLLTFGLLGIGQLIDLVLIPKMVNSGHDHAGAGDHGGMSGTSSAGDAQPPTQAAA